ncbi:MAG: tetratricopeptide repeat protein [Phycisphaerales bacterium]|nr:tetratricopeptide repeat protein [Phycisphaerales bacterium]
MSFRTRTLFLTVSLLGAAAASAQEAAAPQAPAKAAVAPPAPVAPAAPAEAPQTPDGERLFAFWRAPDFQQRFADSLVAESDFEPKVGGNERELLLEIADGLGKAPAEGMVEAQDRAIEKLLKRTDKGSGATQSFMLGSLLFQRERLVEAAGFYEQAVGKHTTFRRAWKNLSLVHMRLGNFKDAQRALTKTIQLGGGDGLTFGLLGFALGGTDDQIGAESAYRMASMLDPTVLDYRMGLARALFKQRRFAEAATLAGTLVAQYPDRGDLWMLQANAYAGMNELKKAAENLELVDRLGQSTAESLHLLGDIYTNDELTDLAASAYLRAIAKDGKGDVGRAMRAAKALAARAAHGECEQVLGAIDKAFGAKMDDGAKKDALKLRARIAVARGAGEEEARILEQTVALDPLDGEALILLGQFHARNGKPDLAILQYERAAGVPAFEADAKVRHAQLLVGQARYAEALPLLRRAQQVKPRETVQQFLDQVERVAQGK